MLAKGGTNHVVHVQREHGHELTRHEFHEHGCVHAVLFPTILVHKETGKGSVPQSWAVDKAAD